MARDSRRVLLQRRLDERNPSVRIPKTSWGKFCLALDVDLTLELVDCR